MTAIRWIGRAQAVAQVDTVTMAGAGDWVQGDTITLTINDKDLVVTIGTLVTDAQVATTVKQAWENETLTDTSASFTPEDGGQDIVEHSEITATVSGDVVTLTHDTPGVPFTLTVTQTVSGDETATEATATAATGPNFWDNVDNWDTGSLPADTDDVYIDNSAISILYNIEPNLGAGSESLASLNIGQNFTGTIGLPQLNAGGYVEYRPQYLKVEADVVVIGRGSGTGSGRIKLDTDAQPSAITVENTGSPVEFGLEAFLWKGTNTTNTLNVIQGSVGIAALGGETANLSALRVTSGDVRAGAGLTFNTATVTNQSGSIEIYSNVTTVENVSGVILIGGTATVTTLTVRGGECDYRSSGTITTLNVGGSVGGTFNCENANVARTITNTTINAGGVVNDPAQTITYTNNPALGTDVRVLTAN